MHCHVVHETLLLKCEIYDLLDRASGLRVGRNWPYSKKELSNL